MYKFVQYHNNQIRTGRQKHRKLFFEFISGLIIDALRRTIVERALRPLKFIAVLVTVVIAISADIISELNTALEFLSRVIQTGEHLNNSQVLFRCWANFS